MYPAVTGGGAAVHLDILTPGDHTACLNAVYAKGPYRSDNRPQTAAAHHSLSATVKTTAGSLENTSIGTGTDPSGSSMRRRTNVILFNVHHQRSRHTVVTAAHGDGDRACHLCRTVGQKEISWSHEYITSAFRPFRTKPNFDW